LRIKEAFPEMFERAYPAIDPTTPIISILPLLQFYEIDALPLSFDLNEKQRGIYGFSCLARILTLEPGRFKRFLEKPCEEVSEPLATVRAEQHLSVLLNAFLRKRFGFARVVERRGAGALVTLSDVLVLYGRGGVKSSLSLEDVASPAFSMPAEATIREALKEMFSRRIRRVFVGESREYVWDRSIIEHIFSPAVLARVAQNASEDILDIPISAIRTSAATEVRGGMKLKDAAAALNTQSGKCLVFDGKVVTPWDVIMKPWKAKELKIRQSKRSIR